MRFVGVKEIDDVLKGLPAQVNHKLLQQAHTQASKVLVEKAKLLAPEGKNGDLVDSIGTMKEGFGKASELGLVQTGPRRRRGRYKGNAGHLVEYGTRSRKLKSNGANRGIMPRRPFMLPAWMQTKERVTGSISQFIGQALMKFMRKTIKNG